MFGKSEPAHVKQKRKKREALAKQKAKQDERAKLAKEQEALTASAPAAAPAATGTKVHREKAVTSDPMQANAQLSNVLPGSAYSGEYIAAI